MRKRRGLRIVLGTLPLWLWAASARAGEAVPAAEMQALERAIYREINSAQLGSSVLGDLTRLRARLMGFNTTGFPAGAGGAASDGQAVEGDRDRAVLARLEAEAGGGGRAARRSLAMYYLYLNDPEKARGQWRLMGRGSDHDLPYLIMSGYLDLALGEGDKGKAALETALARLDALSPLSLSAPVFCTNIAGYRIYAPRREDPLLPGEDALLYVEIDGAEIRALDAAGSGCNLEFGMKLRDDFQRTVWAEPNYGAYSPLFNGTIRDLHAALAWKVPNNLEAGRYHLLVDVVEGWTKRRAEAVIGFEVGKRPTNPETRPTGGPAPDRMPRGFMELRRDLPEAPAIPDPGGPADDLLRRSQRQFDLLQQYERGRKVE
ncbi:MAG: hypothetical protein LBT97_09805 [Planctomycetota bacterium]|jgi:hypothetical protein|nr:hypothetical protein [Planctomycetota bacterium]